MPAPDLRVACLCAAWCQLCAGYRDTFSTAMAALAASGSSPPAFEWIDIEDDADLLDDVDIETFPTLLILDARQVRFFGPLSPQPEVLQRLLRTTLTDAPADARWPAVAPDIQSLAQRLRQRPPVLG